MLTCNTPGTLRVRSCGGAPHRTSLPRSLLRIILPLIQRSLFSPTDHALPRVLICNVGLRTQGLWRMTLGWRRFAFNEPNAG